ncbi:unnamed protein product [Durusdinium trenchii]|uniref:Calcium-dependent protein kinase 2 (PfCDPK2) n=2 Tax=Durusdinium trenchii TaxID=1381693 RepID=A0ABP0SJK2_9DINO
MASRASTGVSSASRGTVTDRRTQGQNRTTRNTTNLRTSAQFLETELTEETSGQLTRSQGFWRWLKRLRRRVYKGLRHEVRNCCGKTVTGRTMYFVATNHPDQVRESLWRALQNLREEWFSAQGGGEYVRRGRQRRRQGVHLAGKRSGAEGPGFGIHCFIINNPGFIEDFYTIEEEVNAGGSAQVFRAVEIATKAHRAIKRIAKKSAGEIARVVQEVAIMKTLDHPNIIKLFETFEDDEYLYLVLEYCGGGDVLDRIISDGAMDELSSSMVIRGMLATLNYLNANGYVHRDIKPENIMYKESKDDQMVSQLRLVDFGYSCRSPEEGKALRTKVGSPYYVAPEVLAGSYGKECDVWSLGAVCFMLVAGIPPFFGETDAQTLRMVKEGRFVFQASQWGGVSKGCKHFIKRCLDVDFAKRLTVIEGLEHPWLKNKFHERVAHIRDETVERLVNFSQDHNLRRAAMLAVAFHMDAEDVKLLLDLFRGLDLNGDGLLTTDEFTSGVRSLGVDSELLQQMMRCLDADHSGVIDYTEFLAATLEAPMFIENHAVMLRAFRSFDQDDSGGLTAEEVAETIDMEGPQQFMEMQRIFEEVDTNRDGVMDYAEFYAMLKAESKEVVAFKVNRPEEEDGSIGSFPQGEEPMSPKAVKFTADEDEKSDSENDQSDTEGSDADDVDAESKSDSQSAGSKDEEKS